MIYRVWSEGFAAQGNSATAQLFGETTANSLKEAVEKLLELKEWNMDLYDPNRLTYWGCKFYDNEIDARKSFG